MDPVGTSMRNTTKVLMIHARTRAVAMGMIHSRIRYPILLFLFSSIMRPAFKFISFIMYLFPKISIKASVQFLIPQMYYITVYHTFRLFTFHKIHSVISAPWISLYLFFRVFRSRKKLLLYEHTML